MIEREIKQREEFFEDFGDILANYHSQNYSQRKKEGVVIKDQASADFGRYLCAVRTRTLLSPAELAARAGAGLTTAKIIALERGLIKSGDIEQKWVKSLARTLKVDVEEFKRILRQSPQGSHTSRPFSSHRGIGFKIVNTVGALAILALFVCGVFMGIQDQFPESVGNPGLQVWRATPTPIPAQKIPKLAGSTSMPPTTTPTLMAALAPVATDPLPETTNPAPKPMAIPSPQPIIEATATPTPDAVIASTVGLNLRSGPGTDYTVLTILRNGDVVEVQGRTANSDWLAVTSANLNLEGWVFASPDYIQLNKDLNSISIVESPPPPPQSLLTATLILTPTGLSYPAVTLTHPENGSGIVGELASLSWEWDGMLGEDEFFEVRMWHESSPYHTALGWVKTAQFDYNISLQQPGKYYWTVIVIRGTDPKPKDWTLQPGWPYRMWDGELIAELSSESEPRFFFFTSSHQRASSPILPAKTIIGDEGTIGR